MNQYTITNIDPGTKAVSVTFEYNGHVLNDIKFIPDITDIKNIISFLNTAYKDFTNHMDAIDTSAKLPLDTQALIGSVQTLDQVNQALVIIPASQPLSP